MSLQPHNSVSNCPLAAEKGQTPILATKTELSTHPQRPHYASPTTKQRLIRPSSGRKRSNAVKKRERERATLPQCVCVRADLQCDPDVSRAPAVLNVVWVVGGLTAKQRGDHWAVVVELRRALGLQPNRRRDHVERLYMCVRVQTAERGQNQRKQAISRDSSVILSF